MANLYKYIMIIKSAEIFQLKIPFKLGFSHSSADRFFSDSMILKLEGKASDGKVYTGWGEAVLREYVSGAIDQHASLLESAGNAVTGLLAPFRDADHQTHIILELLRTMIPEAKLLPLLCAVETAMLDILCRFENKDIYELLEREPERTQLIYGGTLPMLPAPAAEKLLKAYKMMGITNLRIKIGRNSDYNRSTLTLVRQIMGDEYDLKTDTNAGWTFGQAEENLLMLREFGIHIVEEPFGREARGRDSLISRLSRSEAADGMIFMADESALTPDDIRAAAAEKTFGMINIRLAKNGGLLKALDMAETAAEAGLDYMCGCHVGETGILSAAGRAAASLMKAPVYTDGSYDSHLLSGNITTEDLSFGQGGRAQIIRGRGTGFEIDENKLKGFTDERIRCF